MFSRRYQLEMFFEILYRVAVVTTDVSEEHRLPFQVNETLELSQLVARIFLTTYGEERRHIPPKRQFQLVTRYKVAKDICNWHRRENNTEDSVLGPYMVYLYGEANEDTFDEATAHQQQLHGRG
jgi:hypothetical protein